MWTENNRTLARRQWKRKSYKIRAHNWRYSFIHFPILLPTSSCSVLCVCACVRHIHFLGPGRAHTLRRVSWNNAAAEAVDAFSANDSYNLAWMNELGTSINLSALGTSSECNSNKRFVDRILTLALTHHTRSLPIEIDGLTPMPYTHITHYLSLWATRRARALCWTEFNLNNRYFIALWWHHKIRQTSFSVSNKLYIRAAHRTRNECVCVPLPFGSCITECSLMVTQFTTIAVAILDQCDTTSMHNSDRAEQSFI